MGSGIIATESKITSHCIGISSFFTDQGSGITIVMGLGTKFCQAFGIKNQKFLQRNGISEEKTYLVRTLK